MPKLDDVAKKAGVSKSTASRALSGHGSVSKETKKRVEKAATTLGFVASSAAESLATGRSKNIALLTPSVNRWFYGEVIDGVEAALIGAGYDLTLYRLSDNPEQRKALFDYFLIRKGVDAVIALTLFITPAEVERLHSLGKPIVGIGGKIPGVCTYFINDQDVSKRQTEYLLGLGHTRLVHFGGSPESEFDFNVHTNRLAGFRQAMAEAGVEVNDDFFPDEISFSGGYRSALSAFQGPGPHPTGIVAASDEVAIGAISALNSLGLRVPADVSVIGIDGHPVGETIGLTTMVQHASSQGAMAVSQALAMLGGLDPSPDFAMELPVELKVRTSTAPPAQ